MELSLKKNINSTFNEPNLDDVNTSQHMLFDQD